MCPTRLSILIFLHFHYFIFALQTADKWLSNFSLDDKNSYKILTKSIFVAPIFSRCSNGYVDNGMEGCFRIITIKEQTQLEHLLRQLNRIFVHEYYTNGRNNELF